MPKAFFKLFFLSLLFSSFAIFATPTPPPSVGTSPDWPSVPSAPEGSKGDLVKMAVVINNGTGPEAPIERTYKKNIFDVFDDLKNASNDLAPDYNDDTSSIAGTIDLRGVDITVQRQVKLDINSGDDIATLRFCLNIPGKNPDCEDFKSNRGVPQNLRKGMHRVGATEGESTESVWDQLIDWLKGKGGSVLNDLADAWVSYTSIDPVAGNPNSFMAQLTNNNFDLAADGILNGDTSGLDLFSVTPSYVDVTNNGYTVKDATLPIKYSHYFNRNNALIIDMPINYQQIQEATSYSLALGLGYTHVVLRTPSKITWALTPSFHTGVVGSLDLGSGTMMYDGGLASRVVLPHGKFIYGVTNDLSYLETTKVKVGEVETPYDMENLLTQNGVDVTYKLNHILTLGGFFTRFDVLSGLKWYIPSYNEIGIKFAKQTNYKTASYNHLTAALGYMYGTHKYGGINLTLGFNF
jgi:hypothetical protein